MVCYLSKLRTAAGLELKVVHHRRREVLAKRAWWTDLRLCRDQLGLENGTSRVDTLILQSQGVEAVQQALQLLFDDRRHDEQR